mgnify:CR=1 FL=1
MVGVFNESKASKPKGGVSLRVVPGPLANPSSKGRKGVGVAEVGANTSKGSLRWGCVADGIVFKSDRSYGEGGCVVRVVGATNESNGRKLVVVCSLRGSSKVASKGCLEDAVNGDSEVCAEDANASNGTRPEEELTGLDDGVVNSSSKSKLPVAAGGGVVMGARDAVEGLVVSPNRSSREGVVRVVGVDVRGAGLVVLRCADEGWLGKMGAGLPFTGCEGLAVGEGFGLAEGAALGALPVANLQELIACLAKYRLD